MQKLAVVSSSPLFDMLRNQELSAVADLCVPRHYAAGDRVFEQGELGDSLYVIVSGDVEVVQRTRDGKSVLITELTAPEFFGEMGLINKDSRTATVRAKSDTDLLHLTAEALTTFRQQFPDGFTMIVLNIARVLSDRLREANERIGPLPGKGAL